MGVAQLTTLLALVSLLRAQVVWLGRLDPKQLLGSWYILAAASHEKGFMLEKDTRSVEGVVVTLSAENGLKLLSSRWGERQHPVQPGRGFLSDRVHPSSLRTLLLTMRPPPPSLLSGSAPHHTLPPASALCVPGHWARCFLVLS
ncbi:PREDICTED: epididymal-specific lipocalin-6-like [Chinchilla lanigera]|uniref:epididymal-specific lipocalin-6-like n=1 Tax=Chinchilla lanigera TaxID=34839 RepID=UPI00038EA725|nr:PREDICTED: epididymal-specific lipocalin-6-like [Chinchilla lanigera]